MRRLLDDLLELVGMGERPAPAALIDREDAADCLGMLCRESFAHIEHAIGVEIGIAEEQAVAVLELRLRHHGIESRPGIHVALVEGKATVLMLEQHELHVLLGEACRLQRADEEDMRIGAAGHGDPLASEIRHGLDRRLLAGDERRPLRLRIDIHGLDGIAVDAADQGGGTRRGAEIEAAGIEELEGLVAAEAEHPAHRDAVLLEFHLEPALLLEHEAHRVVIGVVHMEFAQRIRSARPAGEPGESDRERDHEDCLESRSEPSHRRRSFFRARGAVIQTRRADKKARRSSVLGGIAQRFSCTC